MEQFKKAQELSELQRKTFMATYFYILSSGMNDCITEGEEDEIDSIINKINEDRQNGIYIPYINKINEDRQNGIYIPYFNYINEKIDMKRLRKEGEIKGKFVTIPKQKGEFLVLGLKDGDKVNVMEAGKGALAKVYTVDLSDLTFK
jgi:hypothetical protein